MCISNALTKNASKIKKSCYIYKTHVQDPYKNLAFEDWMYSKVDFSTRHCLFFWQNLPSIVIGKHQNPWKECRIEKLAHNNVNLCRRSSGGGTVYHDLGNLNLTFFTDKQSYDRKWNLNVIVSALKKQWPMLDIDINKRDDIILDKKHKISGSSAKLGRLNAYHHCTLLINSEKRDIFEYLNNSDELLCNATDSVVSPVANLSDSIKDVGILDVIDCISTEYAERHQSSQKYNIDTGDESILDGIQQLSEGHHKWDWLFGRTPKFVYQLRATGEKFGDAVIHFEIKNGKINNISSDTNNIHDHKELIAQLKQYLIGLDFHSDQILSKLPLLRKDSHALFVCNLLIKNFLQN